MSNASNSNTNKLLMGTELITEFEHCISPVYFMFHSPKKELFCSSLQVHQHVHLLCTSVYKSVGCDENFYVFVGIPPN